MTFGQQALDFHFALPEKLPLPDGVSVLYPFSVPSTREAMTQFFHRYFNDHAERVFLFGINPGRFGAGITGIGFTDPVELENACGIPNSFEKKAELSAQFVYRAIDRYGGPAAFYSDFYITALSPIGFLRGGKNYNYYDSRRLYRAVRPFMVGCIRQQLDFGCRRSVAICIGEGKNHDCFRDINEEFGFFETILPLPHPRYVMQYKRRFLEDYLQRYLDALQLALSRK